MKRTSLLAHVVTLLLLTAPLLGCPDDTDQGGGADAGTTATDDAGVSDDASSSGDATGQADAASPEVCGDLADQYTLLVTTGRSCQVDAQCQTVAGLCDQGLGDCHEPVNASVTQEAIDALGASYGESCPTGGSCACSPPPPSRCVEGTCELAPYCEGGRDIGDVWLAEDGCSLCTCRFEGVTCRDDGCQNPCVDAGLPECPQRACDATIAGEPCHPGAECGDPDGTLCGCGEDGAWTCQQVEFPVAGCEAACLPRAPATCEALASQYDALIADHQACDEDSDCAARQGSCRVGLGRCHEAVNQRLPQASLDALSGPWFEQRCSDEVCTCDPAPPAICEAGRCALGGFCGERDLGDTWPAGDGCNTCTCTLSGAVCTESTCDDPCEGAELPDCPPTCPDGLVEGGDCDTDLSCGDDQGTACVCTDGAWRCETTAPPVEGCALHCRPTQEDTCAQIELEYDALVEGATACDSDSACQWLYGQCGVGLGGCYAAVNTGISQPDLGALGAAFLQAGCAGERCGAGDCGAEPLVRCVEERCQEVEYCAGRELGEVWENGCTVCTCTTNGALCDSSACPTACEQIEQEYAALVAGAQSCTENLDCQILRGHCGVGDCFSYVNLSIEQGDLDALNARYNEEGCVDLLCHCTLPFAVSCVGGVCKPNDR